MEQKRIKKIKRVIGFIILTFIIYQLCSAISGWTIIDPLLDNFGPYKISIEPNPLPQVHEGSTWILTEIRNEGLHKINNLNAEYNLKCEMDYYKKASLIKTQLKRGESDTFEFQANLDPNCSIGTIPYKLKFFRDKITNECYINTSREIKSNICTYCEFNVIVYDGFKEIDTMNYFYPFSSDELTMEIITDQGCKDINEARNIDDLIYEPDKEIKITLYDFCPGCIRGDITDKEWCQKNCEKVYKNN